MTRRARSDSRVQRRGVRVAAERSGRRLQAGRLHLRTRHVGRPRGQEARRDLHHVHARAAEREDTRGGARRRRESTAPATRAARPPPRHARSTAPGPATHTALPPPLALSAKRAIARPWHPARPPRAVPSPVRAQMVSFELYENAAAPLPPLQTSPAECGCRAMNRGLSSKSVGGSSTALRHGNAAAQGAAPPMLSKGVSSKAMQLTASSSRNLCNANSPGRGCNHNMSPARAPPVLNASASTPAAGVRPIWRQQQVGAGHSEAYHRTSRGERRESPQCPLPPRLPQLATCPPAPSPPPTPLEQPPLPRHSPLQPLESYE